ncbi:MAG: hypothetical protein ACHQWU_14765 [Gemmatimonadales bacterium]
MQAIDRSPIVVLGSIAAAATTGALLAIGRRLGGPSVALAAVGNVVVQAPGGAGTPPAILVGLALHVVAAFVWTAVFFAVWNRLQRRDIVAALIVAAGQLALSWIVARASGAGIATVVPLGDRVLLALILALSLVVGMRFAFSPLRNA